MRARFRGIRFFGGLDVGGSLGLCHRRLAGVITRRRNGVGGFGLRAFRLGLGIWGVRLGGRLGEHVGRFRGVRRLVGVLRLRPVLGNGKPRRHHFVGFLRRDRDLGRRVSLGQAGTGLGLVGFAVLRRCIDDLHGRRGAAGQRLFGDRISAVGSGGRGGAFRQSGGLQPLVCGAAAAGGEGIVVTTFAADPRIFFLIAGARKRGAGIFVVRSGEQ